AFHSHLMDPMLPAFEQTAREIRSERLRVPLVSSLTGMLLQSGEILEARYWCRQTREAVQFVAGVQTLVEQGHDLFLELGPTSTLISQGQRCHPDTETTWLPSLQRERDDWEVLLQTASTLAVKGVALDWQGFDGDYVRLRVPLPTYPFEQKRYWFETEAAKRDDVSAAQVVDAQTGHNNSHNDKDRHPFLDTHMVLADPFGTHVWETVLHKQRLPYLNDHRIQGVM